MLPKSPVGVPPPKTTMAHPAAMAADTFLDSIASGKFHGEINPTTPAGR